MTASAIAPPVRPRARLRLEDGGVVDLEVERWHAAPSSEDLDVLGRAVGPVLDVGCGPGRLTLALHQAGLVALGIDTSPSAVTTARRRGAAALERSVFDRVPGTGRWGTALLLDGNVGIGGDPARLLRRLRSLLAAGGRVLAEVGPPSTGSRRLCARLEVDDAVGPAFPWAVVAADDAGALALGCGFAAAEVWSAAGRWFARLERTPGEEVARLGGSVLAPSDDAGPTARPPGR